jgi:hypothetical protein
MNDPTRIKYRSHDQIPSTTELLTKVTRDQHLVLELPANYNRQHLQSVINRIASETPENYRTFFAGGFQDKICATIMQVVSRDDVIDMEEDLLLAARHFRRTATDLAEALATYNHVEPDCLWENCDNLKSHSKDWTLDVHGDHCCFKHRSTGLTVEINMWFGREFGVLDPFFFYNYMKTSPELEPPVELRDAFHDTHRAMEILEERGRLVKITGMFESIGLTSFDSPSTEHLNHP